MSGSGLDPVYSALLYPPKIAAPPRHQQFREAANNIGHNNPLSTFPQRPTTAEGRSKRSTGRFAAI
jgi:hypothetical protein